MAKKTNVYPTEIEKRLCKAGYAKLDGLDFRNKGISAVLFLLTGKAEEELSLILTKRSKLVSQPGDLCSPGGGVSPLRDKLFRSLLLLPGMPLNSWRELHLLRQQNRKSAAAAVLLAAAAVRETWEEIGLNPLQVRLLGTLEPCRLTVFDKTIFPICAWTQNSAKLNPNREVESIHHVPLAQLLDPKNYAAYSIKSDQHRTGDLAIKRETICYRHFEGVKEEILWGATLGITLSFLKTVYNFTPPARDKMPLVESVFSEDYFKKL